MVSFNTLVGNCEILARKIQLHAMDALSKPIPLHIQHHCITQTSAALAAYYKKKKKHNYS